MGSAHLEIYLKELADELTPAFTFLCRSSLLNGIVPADWKTAFVTAVFKKGERHQAKNYHPIALTAQSLTSVPCKLMEHFIISSVMVFAKKNIICPEQHRVRQGLSCETQLLGMTDEFFHNLEKGLQTDILIVALIQSI